jgi:hypothetical protein
MLVGQHTGSEYHLVVTAESLLDAIFVDPVNGQIVYLTRTIQSVTTLHRLEESTGSFCQLFTIDWTEEDKSGKPLITDSPDGMGQRARLFSSSSKCYRDRKPRKKN